ncbi:MAG: hypothetical protein ABSC94_11915 [Polyangiaceae bacterium]
MNTSTGDSWYVKLSDGDVHRVTLDQLDEAFQAGHIDGDTMVLAAGASQWTTLGALAGIDEGAASSEPEASAVPSYIPQVQSFIPQGHAPTGAFTPQSQSTSSPGRPMPRPAPLAPNQLPTTSLASAPPANAFAPPAANAFAPPAANTFAPPAANTFAPPAANPFAPGSAQSHGFTQARQNAIAPNLNAFAPPNAFAPRQAAAQNAATQRGPDGNPALGSALSPYPTSLRPVSVDFGELDVDLPDMRRRPKTRLIAGLLAITASLGGVAAVAVTRPHWAQPVLSRMGVRAEADVMAAAAPPPPVAAPPPAAAAEPPPAAPDPSPASLSALAATPVGDSPLNPRFTNTANDDPKSHSPEKPSKAKAHKTGRGVPGHASSAGKSTTFTTGGSKYDPLNSSI